MVSRIPIACVWRFLTDRREAQCLSTPTRCEPLDPTPSSVTGNISDVLSTQRNAQQIQSVPEQQIEQRGEGCSCVANAELHSRLGNGFNAQSTSSDQGFGMEHRSSPSIYACTGTISQSMAPAATPDLTDDSLGQTAPLIGSSLEYFNTLSASYAASVVMPNTFSDAHMDEEMYVPSDVRYANTLSAHYQSAVHPTGVDHMFTAL